MVHVRIGDVVDRANHSVEEMLANQTYYYDAHPGEAWNAYVKPMKHFQAIAASIPPGKKVVLLAGAHDPDHKRNLTKSCIYLHSVSNFFNFLHIPVTLRVGHDPDSDVSCAAQSSSFAPSGGGFSQLLSEMVVLNGGNIIRTEFTPQRSMFSMATGSDAVVSPSWETPLLDESH
jgi:hypothetical protein